MAQAKDYGYAKPPKAARPKQARPPRPAARPAEPREAARPARPERPKQPRPPRPQQRPADRPSQAAMPAREWMKRNEERKATPVPVRPAMTTPMQDYANRYGTRGVYPGAMPPNQRAASYPDWARQYGYNALYPGTLGGGAGRTPRPRGWTPTLLPDIYAAQQQRNRGMPTTPTSMPDALMGAIQRPVGTGSGIPRPRYVSPTGEGYAEEPGYGGYGEDWGDWGEGGGGGGYTPSSYPGYTDNAYAQGQAGYNPMRAQTPRWWHNRLTWRF